MKINVKNTDKLNAAIDAVEGTRCTARTVSAGGVQYFVDEIENRLKRLLIKADWRGLVFFVDPHAQTFPGAYRGQPESTHFILERGADNWFITRIERNWTHGPNERIQAVNIITKIDLITTFLCQPKNWSK